MHKVMMHAVLLVQIFGKFLIAFFDDIPKTTSFYCQLCDTALFLYQRCFYLKRGIKTKREKEEG